MLYRGKSIFFGTVLEMHARSSSMVSLELRAQERWLLVIHGAASFWKEREGFLPTEKTRGGGGERTGHQPQNPVI